MTEDFDKTLLKLGALCKRKHAYKETSMSLRYISDTSCVECKKARGQSKEKRQYDKTRYSNNAERLKEMARARYARLDKDRAKNLRRAWYLKNQERILSELKANYDPVAGREKNRVYRNSPRYRERLERKALDKDHVKSRSAYMKKYRKTVNGMVAIRRGSLKRRGRLNAAQGDFSKEELSMLLAKFDRSCAYCGDKLEGRLTLDHVVPVLKGGTNFISNLVPCCQTCNSSKNARTMAEWFRGKSYFCPNRLNKILAHSKTCDSPNVQLSFL